MPQDIVLHHQYEGGDGPCLVFLHGWLDALASWDDVRAELSLPNPQLLYDQRCHGESPCRRFDMDDLAADLDGLVAGHGLEEPILVGHSMGGMVALAYAAQYDNLGGLFLVATCASTPDPKLKSPAWYLEHFDKIPRDEWARMIVENYLGGKPGESWRSWKESVRRLVEADDEPVEYGLEAMIDYDVRDRLRDADIDACVVAGRYDNTIREDQTQELARLLDCDRHVLDTSHRVIAEAPDELAALLSSFVDAGQ